MEKPKVFASPINKKINNSQELFYEKNNRNIEEMDSKDVNKKINDIFNNYHHVYKSRVSIITKDQNIICDLVGKTDNSILTLDGKTIRISDIKDIKKI